MIAACTSPLRRAARAALALALALSACSRGPDEPEPAPPAPTAAAVAPLAWDAPGSWTALDVPRSGPKKAAYKVPKAANDKEDVEVHVLFYGTGSQGDPEKQLRSWFEQFDGDVGKDARRERFEVRGMEVETVEVEGTYKIALTPGGSSKKSPVQMVKKGSRLVGAVVKTKDRGNWFFKMTGPDETVQSARSALRALLESAR